MVVTHTTSTHNMSENENEYLKYNQEEVTNGFVERVYVPGVPRPRFIFRTHETCNKEEFKAMPLFIRTVIGSHANMDGHAGKELKLRSEHRDAILKILSDEKTPKTEVLNTRSKFNKTALFHSPSIEISQLLIEQGIDINVCDSIGDTMLHQSYWFMRLKLIMLLIDNGADLSIKNKTGQLTMESTCSIHLQTTEKSTADHYLKTKFLIIENFISEKPTMIVMHYLNKLVCCNSKECPFC